MIKGTPSPDAHQFYITHCARSDSVLHTVGFSVRAASTGSNDPELLKLAMEYPAYELPMEMWAKKPKRSMAPRRLARIETPRGVMMVHTSYLEKDTMNRDRSYFSHVVLLPSQSPTEVLESWGANLWRTDYSTGETKDLPRPALSLSSGPALSPEFVSNFLASQDLGEVVSLAEGCWNETLRQDPKARRELVGRVVCGIIRASAADRGRNRLYIHAEPGVVAALIYAAAQLLPPTVVDKLTFTTFEPAHRGLKEFKRALAVGTYLAQPNRGLDSDLVHQSAYVVDCFQLDRSSPQLLGPLPVGVEKLLDLAAEGRWEVLGKVHSVCGKTVSVPEDLERPISLASALDRLEQGKRSPSDLIFIQQDEMGRKSLQKNQEDLWPHILKLALDEGQHRDSIRHAYRVWFAEDKRILKIAKDAFGALQKGDVPIWEAHWHLVRSVLDQPKCTAAMEYLLVNHHEAIFQMNLQLRSAMRATLKGRELVGQKALASLFDPISLDELEELLNDKTLAPGTVANAAYAARCKVESEMHERVLNFLDSASPEALGEYAKLTLKNRYNFPEIARELFYMNDQGDAPYLDRLLDSFSKYVTPDDWLWFVDESLLRVSDQEQIIAATMLRHNRLSKLLLTVCQEEGAKPLWGMIANMFTINFLGRTNARYVLQELTEFRELMRKNGLNEEVPFTPLVKKRLQAAELIQAVFAKGFEASKGEIDVDRKQILEAFKAFESNPDKVLDNFFKWFSYYENPGCLNKIDQIAYIFLVCIPQSNGDFEKNRHSLERWIKLFANSDQEFQKESQKYFFKYLAPQKKPEQSLELLKEFSTKLNRDVLANFVMVYSKSAYKKSSRKKNGGRRWMHTKVLITGGILVVIAVMVITLWSSKGTPDTPPVAESTPSDKREDPSNSQARKDPGSAGKKPVGTPSTPPQVEANAIKSPTVSKDPGMSNPIEKPPPAQGVGGAK